MSVLQDCLHLHATVSAQAERVLLVEPTATPRDVGPTSKQVARLKGGTLSATLELAHWSALSLSMWNDTFPAKCRSEDNVAVLYGRLHKV